MLIHIAFYCMIAFYGYFAKQAIHSNERVMYSYNTGLSMNVC